MAKRFIDTELHKKDFFRALPGPYKGLWEYLCRDCNHAGIWHVDKDVAQIYVGLDRPIDLDEGLTLFNSDKERVRPIDNGKKWYLTGFVKFQYDKEPEELNPANNAHRGIIKILNKYGLIDKPLTSPSLGALDKDKEKDKEKERLLKNKMCDICLKRDFNEFWEKYPKRNGRKVGKADAEALFKKLTPEEVAHVLTAVKHYSVGCGDYPKDPHRFLKPERGGVEPVWKSWVDTAETSEESREAAHLAELKAIEEKYK